MRKTFKIGEYAKGGIIQVDIKNINREKTQIVTLTCVDYLTKKKIDEHKTEFYLGVSVGDVRNSFDILLNDWTSNYYAEKVQEYIYNNLNKGL